MFTNTAVFCQSSFSRSSSKFSRATLTASTTKAVKVQDLPDIAFSTSSITSLGKRMLLVVVGGTDGILNFRNNITPLLSNIVYKKRYILCIANVLQMCILCYNIGKEPAISFRIRAYFSDFKRMRLKKLFDYGIMTKPSKLISYMNGEWFLHRQKCTLTCFIHRLYKTTCLAALSCAFFCTASSRAFFLQERKLPKMSFADDFKAARKALKLTQEDVAKLLKLDRTAIAHYENGTAFPRAANIRKISEILKIPIDEMLKQQPKYHKIKDASSEQRRKRLTLLYMLQVAVTTSASFVPSASPD